MSDVVSEIVVPHQSRWGQAPRNRCKTPLCVFEGSATGFIGYIRTPNGRPTDFTRTFHGHETGYPRTHHGQDTDFTRAPGGRTIDKESTTAVTVAHNVAWQDFDIIRAMRTKPRTSDGLFTDRTRAGRWLHTHSITPAERKALGRCSSRQGMISAIRDCNLLQCCV